MVYTEVRNIRGKKYYYRVISVRDKNKISKKRVYLGCEIPKVNLLQKEKEADRKLLPQKPNKELENIKSKIVSVLKRNKVSRAGIFGSYSRGEQKKSSDIDIAVEIEDKNMSLLDFIRLIRLLEEVLKRKVDLVEYSAIKPRVKNRILKEEVRVI